MEIDMMAIIKMAKSKDQDNLNGTMELYILGNSCKIICMEKENIFGKIKDNMRENG